MLEQQEFVKPKWDSGHCKKGEAGLPFGSPAQLGEEANTVVWFSDAVLISDIQAKPCRGMIPTLPDCHLEYREKERFVATTGKIFALK